jgi:hypothetical protein
LWRGFIYPACPCFSKLLLCLQYRLAPQLGIIQPTAALHDCAQRAQAVFAFYKKGPVI